MNLYYGTCPSETCHFSWSVEGRIPNYCPECGRELWSSNEEILVAQQYVHHVNIVEEEKDGLSSL